MKGWVNMIIRKCELHQWMSSVGFSTPSRIHVSHYACLQFGYHAKHYSKYNVKYHNCRIVYEKTTITICLRWSWAQIPSNDIILYDRCDTSNILILHLPYLLCIWLCVLPRCSMLDYSQELWLNSFSSPISHLLILSLKQTSSMFACLMFAYSLLQLSIKWYIQH